MIVPDTTGLGIRSHTAERISPVDEQLRPHPRPNEVTEGNPPRLLAFLHGLFAQDTTHLGPLSKTRAPLGIQNFEIVTIFLSTPVLKIPCTELAKTGVRAVNSGHLAGQIILPSQRVEWRPEFGGLLVIFVDPISEPIRR